jgi:septum formation topological specificity factor MinE
MKEIFVEGGKITFATSNQVRDSLGDKLLREGKITREQYDESVRRLVDTGKRQGTILTEMNVIDNAGLVTALREQILELVWSVFAWDTGQIVFTLGRHKQQEFIKGDIPIPKAVLQGIRRMPDAKALVVRLGTKATVLVRSEKPLGELTLEDDERRLLDAVDGKRTLYDLINTPPLPAGTNARILYAFVALQLIAARSPERIKVRMKTGGDTYE